jgi:hypothetical protein
LEIQTTASLPVPVEATVRFRAAVGDTIAVRAVTEEQNAKPLLECQFTLQSDNHATVIALSSGAPMATVINSALRADYRDKKTGQLGWFSVYSWRFPKVKNLWDERDYKEIGAANAQLVPFEDKVFTLRLTLTATTRQIWLDDRLVAEEQVANSQPVRLVVQLAKTTKVLAADFSAIPALGAGGLQSLKTRPGGAGFMCLDHASIGCHAGAENRQPGHQSRRFNLPLPSHAWQRTEYGLRERTVFLAECVPH